MKNQTKNLLIASLSGAAVGALAGILLAPAKGKETRAAIVSKAKELTSKAKSIEPMDVIANIKNKIDTTLTNGKTEVKNELLEQIEKLESTIEKA